MSVPPKEGGTGLTHPVGPDTLGPTGTHQLETEQKQWEHSPVKRLAQERAGANQRPPCRHPAGRKTHAGLAQRRPARNQRRLDDTLQATERGDTNATCGLILAQAKLMALNVGALDAHTAGAASAGLRAYIAESIRLEEESSNSK